MSTGPLPKFLPFSLQWGVRVSNVSEIQRALTALRNRHMLCLSAELGQCVRQDGASAFGNAICRPGRPYWASPGRLATSGGFE